MNQSEFYILHEVLSDHFICLLLFLPMWIFIKLLINILYKDITKFFYLCNSNFLIKIDYFTGKFHEVLFCACVSKLFQWHPRNYPGNNSMTNNCHMKKGIVRFLRSGVFQLQVFPGPRNVYLFYLGTHERSRI